MSGSAPPHRTGPSDPVPVEAFGAYAFVDLAGFTALAEAHGDRAAADLVDRLYELARATLAGRSRLAKGIGDAVLLVGPDPADLLAGTASLLSRLAEEPAFPLPRAGATAGPALHRDGDVIGTAVNIAARLAARATGGQLLIGSPLLPVAAGLHLPARTIGPLQLRNLREPVWAYDLDYPSRPGRPVTDPVCRMRLDAADAAAVLRGDDGELHFCSRQCLTVHLEGLAIEAAREPAGQPTVAPQR